MLLEFADVVASMEPEDDYYPINEAPDQLQMERERSSLVWQELMDVVLGWEFVTMKRDKGTCIARYIYSICMLCIVQSCLFYLTASVVFVVYNREHYIF